MSSIFEPTDSVGRFDRSIPEYQVTVEPTSDLGGENLSSDSDDAPARSFQLPSLIFIALVLMLVFRLVNLQISQQQLFQGLAKGNRIETRRLVPPRGLIVDRLGQPLTKNVPLYELNLYPAQLPKEKVDRQSIYQSLEEVTGIKAADIVIEVDKHGRRSLEPLTLKSNIARDTALLWQAKLSFISGLSVEERPIRSYEPNLGLSQLLGYVGKVTDKELKQQPDLDITAIVGKAGIEFSYDRYLQGQTGLIEMEVDSKGHIQRQVASEAALPGNILEAHIDKELQQVMVQALLEGAQRAGRTKATAIALDPQTGGVLGLVSLPDYDNNAFVLPDKQEERQAIFDSQDQPLFNRAISGLYPPGSTVKPIWASAALQEGLITDKTDLKTPAEIRIGQFVFPDWKYHEHASVRQAIAESNNIFFYAVAGGYDKIKGLGPLKLKEYAEKFGLGQPTGIDLPAEAQGAIPDPDWKKRTLKENWYIGDTYNLGIGQGYLTVTPIQSIQSIVAIANGGTLYQPRVVSKVKDLSGKIIDTPGPKILRSNIIEPAHLQVVREGMRQTVLEGTARPLNEIPMPIAGKTGTAQFSDPTRTHAWFVGFAPYDQPTIALLVMVEGGGESFTVAVPIAKQILSWYSEHRYTKCALRTHFIRSPVTPCTGQQNNL